MNKKGFTLIELLGVIMILAIIMGVATYSYNNYLKKGRDKSFNLAVNNFKDALKSAYIDCESNFSRNSFCSSHSIPDLNESDTVTLSDLVTNQYIDKIKNPYKNDEYCSEANSYIQVTKKTVTIKHNVTGKNTIEDLDTEDTDVVYKVCLVCGDKRSNGCN